MLQYPTNVYPADSTFDATVNDDTNKLKFTFNGDIFTGVLFKVYNYDTGEFIKDGAYMLQNHAPIGFNGDTIETDTGFFGYTGSANPPLVNGTNYVLQLQLVQFKQSVNEPLYDMFVLRGDIQEDYNSSTDYVVIKTNIPNIYEWDTYSTDGARRCSTAWQAYAGLMQIVINGEKRRIVAYNPSNGHVMIDPNTPFTTPIVKGTKYQIYSNYIVTQPYYFQCRAVPSVNVTLETFDLGTVSEAGVGFLVNGEYSQSDGSMINYYKVKLQWNWTTDGSAPWRTIDESEKIYSQKIQYSFFDDFVLRYKRIVNGEIEDVSAIDMEDVYYRAVVEVVTADGNTIINHSPNVVDTRVEDDCPETRIHQIYPYNNNKPDVYYPDSIDADIQLRTNNLKHIVQVVGGIVFPDPPFPSGTKFTYYRENLDTGEIRLLETIYDATVPTRGRFRYYEIPRRLHPVEVGTPFTDMDRFVKGISYADIEFDGTQMDGCTITELILRDKEFQWGTRPRYEIGDQWKFVGEIQNTTITQNGDRYAHVGYGTYPQITSTKTNYLSGSVSAIQGYVDCTTKKYTDNIDLVRAWRQFILRQSLFMLKTQKGDVLVVGIVNNPTTTYDDSLKDLPTTFSFDWIELCDINDIKVDYHVNTDPNDVY